MKRLLLLLCFIPQQALAQARELPDNKLTPGVVRAITIAEIKSTKWGLDKRMVTDKMRSVTYARYKVTGDHDKSCGIQRCEVDHRLPRECGGADDINNLWVQSYPSWHLKDRLENWAHKQVLLNKLTVNQCQNIFFANWQDTYSRVFK